MTDTERWQAYVAKLQQGDVPPFLEQLEAFQRIYASRTPSDPPPPAWLPSDHQMRRSNIGRFMAERDLECWADLHRWSTTQREAFWAAAIEGVGVVFREPPERTLELERDPRDPMWLPGARFNIVDSCFTADPSLPAVITASEADAAPVTVTYGELEALVNRFANGLAEHGFSPGDGIALYMPMTLECVAAYLGALRAGCFVVSIADSFSTSELGKRLEIGGARGVVTVDRYSRAGRQIDLYAKVRAAGAPRAVVVGADDSQTPLRAGDVSWCELLSNRSEAASVAQHPDALANVLFSSGTTGTPKAIPWSHTTPIKCAADGHFHQDIQGDNVVAWPTNIGWMMGPWLIFASLINNATMALFEGGPGGPDFTAFVERARVSVLGVVPSLVRAWRNSGACDGADWSGVRVLSSTGEPSAFEDYLWLMSRTGYRAPVIEYCGGTEIGGGHVTGTVVQPASPAAFSTPALGMDMVILDERGREVDEGASGEVFLIPPSIGLSQRLLNADHEAIYHRDCPEGPSGALLRRHGDQMLKLPGGFLRAQGRADDTMNLGGVKVSSKELESVVEGHPWVYECAAVAVQPGGEGAEALVVFLVPAGGTAPQDLHGELQLLIKRELNPLFKIHDVVIREALPRTASNKLMHRSLRAEYEELHSADSTP